MKSLPKNSFKKMRVLVACCLSMSLISSCKYLDRLTKKDKKDELEVSNNHDVNLPNFEFFLFRSSDRRSATFEARNDSAFTCQYQFKPINSNFLDSEFIPCLNDQPALLINESLGTLQPSDSLTIRLKVKIGSIEHLFSFHETNTICVNRDEVPSIELDQVSGLGSIKCVNPTSRKTSLSPAGLSCEEPQTSSIVNPNNPLQVAIKGSFAGRTQKRSGLFKFSNESAIVDQVSVSVRSGSNVFSRQISLKPHPTSLTIKNSKTTIEKKVEDQNSDSNRFDPVYLEKLPMKLSLVENTIKPLDKSVGLSVTLNDPQSLAERTCFNESVPSEIEVSDRGFNNFSTFKFMTVWIRSKAELEPSNPIEFAVLSHLRFKFVL